MFTSIARAREREREKEREGGRGGYGARAKRDDINHQTKQYQTPRVGLEILNIRAFTEIELELDFN